MQQKNETKEDYRKRINLVVEYINNHLSEEIDLNILSDIAGFSPYHSHRIIKAFLGEPVGAFITRTRLEAATKLLRYTELPIQEVAWRVGYDVPSSLSKAFRQLYHISPNEYRNNKEYMIMKPTLLSTELNLKAPRIVEQKAKNVIYIRLTGDYSDNDYGATWTHLWEYVKEQKLFSAGIEHFCIYHDDPQVTAPEKRRADICLVIHKPAEPKGEIGVKEIEGGKYAVFLYQGPYSNLSAVYDTIYSKWLPEKGYKLVMSPCLEKYLNNPNRTIPEKLKTEIYIPIE